MKLKQFLKMWEEDGTKLSHREERAINGTIWLLYAVYFLNSTYDYGRHMAMILKVDKKSKEILMHDLVNLSGEVTPNYTQGIHEWFDKHAGKY